MEPRNHRSRPRRRLRSWIVAATAACGLTACAAPEPPADTFYRIDVQPAGQVASSARLAGIIEVERPDAVGLVNGRPIVFAMADRPNELREYNYHFWSKPPATMLRDQLLGYLRVARLGQRVVTEEMRVDADYAITGKLIEFEHVVGSPSTFQIAMELGLRDVRQDRLVHVATYRADAPANDDTVTAAVAAAAVAFGDICEQFVADVSKGL